MSSEASLSSSSVQSPADPGTAHKSRQRQSHQSQGVPSSGTLIPNRIFVGGIPQGTDEAELRKFFSVHGVVSDVKIIADKSGSSRCYGFVTFEEVAVAEKIVRKESRDGLMFNQRRINIGPAIKKPPTNSRLDSGGLNSAAAAAAASAAAAISAATSYPSGQIALQSLLAQSQTQQQQQLSHSLVGQMFPAELLLGSLATAQQPQLLAAPWLAAAALQQHQQHPLQLPLSVLQQQQFCASQQPTLPSQQLFDVAAAGSPSGAKRRRCADWPLSEWNLQ